MDNEKLNSMNENNMETGFSNNSFINNQPNNMNQPINNINQMNNLNNQDFNVNQMDNLSGQDFGMNQMNNLNDQNSSTNQMNNLNSQEFNANQNLETLNMGEEGPKLQEVKEPESNNEFNKGGLIFMIVLFVLVAVFIFFLPTISNFLNK